MDAPNSVGNNLGDGGGKKKGGVAPQKKRKKKPNKPFKVVSEIT